MSGSEETDTDFSDAGICVVISNISNLAKARCFSPWPAAQDILYFSPSYYSLLSHFLIVFLHPCIENFYLFFFSLPFFISLHFLAQMMENTIIFRIQIYVKDSFHCLQKKK